MNIDYRVLYENGRIFEAFEQMDTNIEKESEEIISNRVLKESIAIEFELIRSKYDAMYAKHKWKLYNLKPSSKKEDCVIKLFLSNSSDNVDNMLVKFKILDIDNKFIFYLLEKLELCSLWIGMVQCSEIVQTISENRYILKLVMSNAFIPYAPNDELYLDVRIYDNTNSDFTKCCIICQITPETSCTYGIKNKIYNRHFFNFDIITCIVDFNKSTIKKTPDCLVFIENFTFLKRFPRRLDNMFRIDALLRFTNSFIISVRSLSIQDPILRKITEYLKLKEIQMNIKKSARELSTSEDVNITLNIEVLMPCTNINLLEMNTNKDFPTVILPIEGPPHKKNLNTNLINFDD